MFEHTTDNHYSNLKSSIEVPFLNIKYDSSVYILLKKQFNIFNFVKEIIIT